MDSVIVKKFRSIRLHERAGLHGRGVATCKKVDVLLKHRGRTPKLSERHIRLMHTTYLDSCAA